MYKRRIGNGLAFQPQKDMELFRKMAKKGYHLCEVETIFYKFKKEEPKDYIFSYTATNHPDEDYISYFKNSGWEPVLTYKNLQVFRALPGTEPIYTDKASQVDFYEDEVKKYFKYTIISTVFFAVCIYTSMKIENPKYGNIFFITGLIPFVFTAMPLIGFIYHLIKYKIKTEA